VQSRKQVRKNAMKKLIDTILSCAMGFAFLSVLAFHPRALP
jgi:hypothetical protein